jgi:amino acid transporter
MTGRSAAQDAGPAILLSFVVAGLGCLFAALCYAEFASTTPVAGSAYTYAYATLGELLAWIIGWDLILEYAMACACVASSWSKYLNELLYVLFSWKVPDHLCNAPFTINGFSVSLSGDWLNMPALVITVIVTVILVIGIRESATTNAVLVGVKVGVVLFVIAVGLFFLGSAVHNWTGIPPSERVFAEDVGAIPDLAKGAIKNHSLSLEAAEEEDKKESQSWFSFFYKKDRNQKAVEERLNDLSKKALDLPKDLTPEQVKQDKQVEEMKRRVTAFYEQLKKEKDIDARVQQLTAEVRGLARVQRKQKELQGDPERDEKLAEFKKSLATSKIPALKEDLKQRIDKHQLNQAQADDLLKQAEKEDAYLPTPGTPEAAVADLLGAEVEQAAAEAATDKWGILGYVGLNTTLEQIDDRVRSPFIPYGLAGIVFGASIVFFAYIGFDAVSTHSEEAKKPARDVPIAILSSLVVCTLLYMGVAGVLTGMVPYNKISPDAAVSNAFTAKGLETNNRLLLGASALISIGALAGMTSVLLITFLSQARIFLAMSRDGLLPPSIFAAVHERFRTPHRSTILTGGIIAIVAAITPITKLEEMVNIGTLFAFIIVCAAVMLLRVQRPEAERPFRTPLIWVVGPLGILVNLIMMLFLPVDTWLRLVVWLVVGLCIYYFYGSSRSTLGREMRGLAPLPGVAAASAAPLPEGDKVLEKSVMMADPTDTSPAPPPSKES